MNIVIGNTYPTNGSGDLEVISYGGSTSVGVRFIDTGFETVSTSANIRAGRVKDKIVPRVYGVGFIGDGVYRSGYKYEHTKAYKAWMNMLTRCYCVKFQKRNPTYKGCITCSDWHNFQKFAEWFYENYPNDNSPYDLDKDIRVKGNKVYSPDRCKFVPRKDNVAASKAMAYSILTPDGKVIDIFNMSEFCRNNNLNGGHMNSVVNGNLGSHKGYRLPKSTGANNAKI